MLWSRMCNLVFKICQQTIQLSKMTTIVDFQRKAKLELVKIDLKLWYIGRYFNDWIVPNRRNYRVALINMSRLFVLF